MQVCVCGESAERWRLEEIVLHIPATGKTCHFPCGQWVESGVTFDLQENVPSSTGTSLLASPVTASECSQDDHHFMIGACDYYYYK